MNVEKIRQRIERRYDERLTALENRRTTLLQKLRDGLPDFTNEFPDVTKLIVFGSLVHPGYFTEISDVDIAVTNLPNLRYWDALLWLEKCLEFENIDLVRIEEARPGILKFIALGLVLHEEKGNRSFFYHSLVADLPARARD